MAIFRNKSKIQITYEVAMILLATLSVATIWNKTGYNSLIVWTTWAVFFVDFVYRFLKSENKWDFIKANPFIVIAAIPLDAVFQFARFARILHLLRLKSITKYYTMPFIKYLKRQHLLVVTGVTFVVVFISIIPLYQLESELESYWEALLSALVALTFFGRTPFEPTTSIGHLIVVLLTIFGVILHGLIISTAVDIFYHTKWVQTIVARFKK
ncbi:hypothetical protein [Thalassobacillus pellis]|uniref:hypothetical protein n=1 Tax=Thalassobacillus pellis TaxID=748008 RepID=UPI00195F5411|nr:hypothetical protein [Thalassobacillus pellis]MBM7553669.1 voltage-gated potassium channel [Thalassobacillus pellis]